MKLSIDDRFKHRIIGVCVIISIGAIFVPALMKRSTHVEKNISIAVKLPPKPALPNVVMKDQQALFQTVKVAHVDISPVSEPRSSEIRIAKAESLSQMNIEPSKLNNKVITKEKNELEPSSLIAQARLPVAPEKNYPVKKISSNITAKAVVKSNPVMSNAYAVQLATFSVKNNALSLVNKLKSKGYKASLNKTLLNKAVVYKVLVGNSPKKQQALILKQQLASTMQLTGMVVSTTGVS